VEAASTRPEATVESVSLSAAIMPAQPLLLQRGVVEARGNATVQTTAGEGDALLHFVSQSASACSRRRGVNRRECLTGSRPLLKILSLKHFVA
jgi:hypothetical protein